MEFRFYFWMAAYLLDSQEPVSSETVFTLLLNLASTKSSQENLSPGDFQTRSAVYASRDFLNKARKLPENLGSILIPAFDPFPLLLPTTPIPLDCSSSGEFLHVSIALPASS